jgi:diacylglycerol O-acyltransferase/trehalose O-mycolyltransferase
MRLPALAAAVCAVAAAIPGLGAPAVARAVPCGGFEELFVPSSMGPVKVQVQWAARGGSAALYLLDGMRAREDANAWQLETNALEQFAGDDVTLVMPVGGESSWYADWRRPSSLNGQQTAYRWETFLTRELPDFLAGYGVDRSRTGVLGPSMGGTAALALAARHRDQFKFAGSLSGYLWLTAPGMRTAIRLAMLDCGAYNVDDMWGLPWDAEWAAHDPMLLADALRGVEVFIAAGSGIPYPYDRPESLSAVVNTGWGIDLEVLARAQTRAFQARALLSGVNVKTYDFQLTGTHSWPYWQDALARSRPQALAALGVG